VLERQYRYSIGRYLYELPAGHVEKGRERKESSSPGSLRRRAGI
jgi:hypothetical protein